jgi:hypothetical protein
MHEKASNKPKNINWTDKGRADLALSFAQVLTITFGLARLLASMIKEGPFQLNG